MAKKQARSTDIRKDVLKALDKAFPDGTVELTIGPDEGYLPELLPELRRELSRIKGAVILYERDPSGLSGESGEFQWGNEADGEHEEPPESDLSSSYHLFFLGLTDERFRYGCDGPLIGEDGKEVDVEGEGQIGCCIGVSLLAPFAMVKLDSLETYEDGSTTYPDLEPTVFDMDMTPRDMDEHFRETFDDEAVQALHALRDQVIQILESHRVAVLPHNELRKPIPWLRAGEEALVGKNILSPGITVQDAFFHREL